MKIFVVYRGSLGDTLLTVPTLRAIKEKYPSSKTIVMISPATKDILEDNPFVDDIIYYQKGKTGFIQILAKLLGCEIVLFLGPSYKTKILAWLLRIPERVAFSSKRDRFLTHYIEKKVDSDLYEAKVYLNLARIIGIETKNLSLYIPPCRPDELAQVNIMLKNDVYSKYDKFITIAPFSANTKKDWPEGNYNKIINNMNKIGYAVVLIGGKELKQKAKLFPKAILLNENLNPRQSAFLISVSKLLICSCSFSLHLASTTKTPIIALYGPSSSARWADTYFNCMTISHYLPCSPCNYEKECPYNIQCMKEITVEEVVDKIKEIII